MKTKFLNVNGKVFGKYGQKKRQLDSFHNTEIKNNLRGWKKSVGGSWRSRIGDRKRAISLRKDTIVAEEQELIPRQSNKKVCEKRKKN